MLHWLIANKAWLLGGISVAVIPAAIGLILLWRERQKRETELGTLEAAYGEISLPKPGTALARTITCEGTARNIAKPCTLWLMVEVDNQIWPKEGQIQLDRYGKWRATIFEDGHSEEFSIGLYVATQAATDNIRRWLEVGRMTGNYPGMRGIPGTRRIARVDGLHSKNVKFEKPISEAKIIIPGMSDKASSSSSAAATPISQQIIYGNFTSISASGYGAQVNVGRGERDLQGLVESLKQAGLPEADAQQLGEIVASEEPESKDEPLGAKARQWLADNLKKATDGTWKMGASVVVDLIKEAVLTYYGLK